MRRRSVARERAIDEINTQQGPPRSVRSAVRRAITLEVAIESALKGGHCPACGARIGRGVRAHFESCDGGERV